jgi:hypothetical protein
MKIIKQSFPWEWAGKTNIEVRYEPGASPEGKYERIIATDSQVKRKAEIFLNDKNEITLEVHSLPEDIIRYKRQYGLDDRVPEDQISLDSFYKLFFDYLSEPENMLEEQTIIADSFSWEQARKNNIEVRYEQGVNFEGKYERIVATDCQTNRGGEIFLEDGSTIILDTYSLSEENIRYKRHYRLGDGVPAHHISLEDFYKLFFDYLSEPENVLEEQITADSGLAGLDTLKRSFPWERASQNNIEMRYTASVYSERSYERLKIIYPKINPHSEALIILGNASEITVHIFPPLHRMYVYNGYFRLDDRVPEDQISLEDFYKLFFDYLLDPEKIPLEQRILW